jgi:NAD(P)-dependent dehydrogenase (short-subunit alcohol dehydrogenase family)
MTNANLLDRALDGAVLPGYTNLGYRLRRRGWGDTELERMDDRVALVTGATSGLGLAAAGALARLGAGVRLLARDAERGEQARERVIERSGDADVEVVLCDLSDLGDIRRFAAAFSARESRLDVLVNNAGVLPAERTVTADGLELAFATNVAGPFLLTKLLLDLLRSSAPSRMVNVSSGGMYTQRLHVDDLQMERERYDGTVAYARTKRAEVVLTELWARRLEGSGVVVHAMHPGWADTPGVRASLPRFHRLTRPLLRTPEQGADTIVWLAAAAEPARSTGGFWHDRRRRPTHRLPWTRESAAEREALWAACERLTSSEGDTT